MKRLFFFLILLIFAFSGSIFAVQNQTTVKIFSDTNEIKPGYPFWLAVKIKVPADAHIYWQNPGQAGIISTITWQLPKGFKIEESHWPYPKAFLEGNLVTYGYNNEIYVLYKVKPSEFLFINDQVIFNAKINLLQCYKQCMPVEITANISIKTGQEIKRNLEAEKIFGKAYQKIPKINTNWQIYAVKKKNYFLKLQINPHNVIKTKITDLQFFPIDSSLVKPRWKYQLKAKQNEFTFFLPLYRDYFAQNEHLKGVLVYKYQDGKLSKEQAILIDIPISQGQVLIQNNLSCKTILILLLFAFIGGIILNLMPCVFPVISLKILQLIKTNELPDSKKFFRLSFNKNLQIIIKTLFFIFGILISLWFLSLVIFFVKAIGEEIGWGFQLQEPWFLVFLIILFFFIVLNLFGFFEIGLIFTRLGSLFSLNSNIGSFLSGILLVIVAVPCTAPLLGISLGVALQETTVVTFLIFTFMGLGLSLPYLIFALIPGLIKFLPKPGEWMIWFKQLLAFPLVLTIVWLSYILLKETNTRIVFLTLIVLVFFSFLVWLFKFFNNNSYKFFFVVIVIISFILLINAISKTELLSAKIENKNFSFTELKDLRNQNKAVLVKVTADWCILCKVNDQMVFKREKFKQLLNQKNIVFLTADWTKKDKAITDFLYRYKRAGVPFYIYFPANSDKTVIFPEVLTLSMVERILK